MNELLNGFFAVIISKSAGSDRTLSVLREIAPTSPAFGDYDVVFPFQDCFEVVNGVAFLLCFVDCLAHSGEFHFKFFYGWFAADHADGFILMVKALLTSLFRVVFPVSDLLLCWLVQLYLMQTVLPAQLLYFGFQIADALVRCLKLESSLVVTGKVGILRRFRVNGAERIETYVCMNIAGMIVSVIVGSYYALMSAEMLSCKLHPQLLRLIHRQTALHVLRVKTEDEMVLLHFTLFTILLPLAVAPLTVQIVRPRGGVDSVNQIVFPETLDVVLVINGTGMAVVLKENVSDEVMIIPVMYGYVFQNCHESPPHL